MANIFAPLGFLPFPSSLLLTRLLSSLFIPSSFNRVIGATFRISSGAGVPFLPCRRGWYCSGSSLRFLAITFAFASVSIVSFFRTGGLRIVDRMRVGEGVEEREEEEGLEAVMGKTLGGGDCLLRSASKYWSRAATNPRSECAATLAAYSRCWSCLCLSSEVARRRDMVGYWSRTRREMWSASKREDTTTRRDVKFMWGGFELRGNGKLSYALSLRLNTFHASLGGLRWCNNEHGQCVMTAPPPEKNFALLSTFEFPNRQLITNCWHHRSKATTVSSLRSLNDESSTMGEIYSWELYVYA